MKLAVVTNLVHRSVQVCTRTDKEHLRSVSPGSRTRPYRHLLSEGGDCLRVLKIRIKHKIIDV